jgi:hypothetical protein
MKVSKDPQPPELKGLGSLAMLAYRHWEEFLPKKFKALKEEGRLRDALEKASSRAADALLSMSKSLQVEKGYSPIQANLAAEEVIYPLYLTLPAESEQNPQD